MKVFFVGDFKNNTGPGIANRAIRKGLIRYNNMMYSDANSKISRVFELLVKTIKADCVCFCSPSKANIIGLRIARVFNKKSFYVMHGYLTLESKINNENIGKKEIEKINSFEKYIFKNVDRVYCVSEAFMNYMKDAEPDFKEKFDYNYNGLDLNEIKNSTEKYSANKKQGQIVSIGGGMKRKNNLVVCEAIDTLNKEKNMNLKYIVIGLPYTDKDEICSYNFVTYYDELPHEKVLEILAESYLYVQNSTFETFGLALIEALFSNCNLLVSSRVGAIGVIKTITDADLIIDQDNVEEISSKIEKIIYSGNVKRLYDGVLEDEIGLESAAESLVNKISSRLV